MENEFVEVRREWFKRLRELGRECEEDINVDKKNQKWAEIEANSRLNKLLGYIEATEYVEYILK